MNVTVEDLEITIETAENDIDISVDHGLLEQAPAIVVLSDAAWINLEFSDYLLRDFFLDTSQAALTANVRNFGYAGILTMKKSIAGDTIVTLQGTGLKFVDLKNANSTVSSTLAVTISGNQNGYFEIHLKDSGDTDSGDRIILVVWR